jgi:tripartite-type tricarboxylate transporter receptor subunit TctC
LRLCGEIFAVVFPVTLAVAPAAAQANDYPTKPVRLVVPFAPGGTTDIVARIVAQKLGDVWKRQVVIDNRGGAGGSLGTEIVARAQADGYTLLFGLQTTHAVNPAVYKNLPFDALRDFIPVTRVAISPQLLVAHPALQTPTLREFVARVKAAPGKYTYASSGTGTSQHLAFEMFKRAAGLDMAHIPYKGTAPAMAELVGGHTQALIGGVVALLPHVKAGRLHAVAMASANRSMAAPEVPTMNETLLPGFSVSPWFGLFYPARTPNAIVDKLFHDVTTQVLAAPDLRQRVIDQGAEIAPSVSKQEFAAFVAAEHAHWRKTVEAVMPARP